MTDDHIYIYELSTRTHARGVCVCVRACACVQNGERKWIEVDLESRNSPVDAACYVQFCGVLLRNIKVMSQIAVVLSGLFTLRKPQSSWRVGFF